MTYYLGKRNHLRPESLPKRLLASAATEDVGYRQADLVERAERALLSDDGYSKCLLPADQHAAQTNMFKAICFGHSLVAVPCYFAGEYLV